MIFMKNRKGSASNKKNSVSKLDIIADKLQVPYSAICNTPRFEMIGNKEVVVEGCKSIVSYDEDIIKISTGKLKATFFGRNLNIKCLSPDSLVVVVFITSIEFDN